MSDHSEPCWLVGQGLSRPQTLIEVEEANVGAVGDGERASKTRAADRFGDVRLKLHV